MTTVAQLLYTENIHIMLICHEPLELIFFQKKKFKKMEIMPFAKS